jgi:DNA-binding NarL/FixJ family response regulator
VSNEIRILIADDHPLVRKALRDALAEDTALRIVAEADNGAAAMELIQQTQPDVAILDIHMPKLNGIELARTIQLERLPTAVIILTGDEEPELLHTALKAGVKGYLRKDSAIVEIIASVRAVAAGKLFISAGFSGELPHPQSLVNAPPALKNLTPAERRILKLIAEGRSSKDIAETMSIHYRTVDNHRTRISHKLNLHGSHALLRFAIEHKDELV